MYESGLLCVNDKIAQIVREYFSLANNCRYITLEPQLRSCLCCMLYVVMWACLTVLWFYTASTCIFATVLSIPRVCFYMIFHLIWLICEIINIVIFFACLSFAIQPAFITVLGIRLSKWMFLIATGCMYVCMYECVDLFAYSLIGRRHFACTQWDQVLHSAGSMP